MVSVWELGRSTPDEAMLQLLEKVLNTSLRSGDRADDAFTESSSLPQFGLWVRRQREENGLSVADLAEAARISLPALYNIESGRSANPRLETRNRLTKALKVEAPAAVLEAVEEQSSIAGMAGLVDFDPHNSNDWPTDAGVYVFYDISQRPIYVGESDNIRRRVKSHEEKFWFKYPIVATAAYVTINDKDLRLQMRGHGKG
jgi:transcriptional regulator with XRE-family HTH domain